MVHRLSLVLDLASRAVRHRTIHLEFFIVSAEITKLVIDIHSRLF
jgi:hypothetical protein